MKLPFTNSIEGFVNKYGIIFTMIVMYQGLFGGMVINNEPKILNKLKNNVLFKYLTLFSIGFTATKDVETTLMGLFIFIIIIHLLRTKKERKNITLSNFI